MNNPSRYIEQKVDLRRWFFSVIGWESVITLLVVFVPYLLSFLFPGNTGIAVLLSILLVVVIFVARLIMGIKTISKNHCGLGIKLLQTLTLYFCFFFLFLFDITVCFFPEVMTVKPSTGFMMVILFYFLLISFAVYPGKTTYVYEEKDFLDKDWAE